MNSCEGKLSKLFSLLCQSDPRGQLPPEVTWWGKGLEGVVHWPCLQFQVLWRRYNTTVACSWRGQGIDVDLVRVKLDLNVRLTCLPFVGVLLWRAVHDLSFLCLAGGGGLESQVGFCATNMAITSTFNSNSFSQHPSFRTLWPGCHLLSCGSFGTWTLPQLKFTTRQPSSS